MTSASASSPALMKKPTRQDSQPAKMPPTTRPIVAATPVTAA
jgi:hypothetical protein